MPTNAILDRIACELISNSYVTELRIDRDARTVTATVIEIDTWSTTITLHDDESVTETSTDGTDTFANRHASVDALVSFWKVG